MVFRWWADSGPRLYKLSRFLLTKVELLAIYALVTTFVVCWYLQTVWTQTSPDIILWLPLGTPPTRDKNSLFLQELAWSSQHSAVDEATDLVSFKQGLSNIQILILQSAPVTDTQRYANGTTCPLGVTVAGLVADEGMITLLSQTVLLHFIYPR